MSIRIIPMHFSCSLSKPTFQITNSIWNGSNGNSITTLFYTILQSAISNGKIYGVKETRCMHMDKIITIRTFYMKQNFLKKLRNSKLKKVGKSLLSCFLLNFALIQNKLFQFRITKGEASRIHKIVESSCIYEEYFLLLHAHSFSLKTIAKTPDKLNRIEIQVYGISFIWFLSVHENKEKSPKSAITQNLLNSTLSVYSFTTVALNVQNVKNLSRMKCFKHFIE